MFSGGIERDHWHEMCDEAAQGNVKLTKYIHRETVTQKSFKKKLF